MGLRYEVVRVDCSALGSGDLAGRPASAVAPASEWWPFRNQLILTLAGTAALQFGETELLIGALRTDGHHADGRAEFIEKISALMEMQEGGLKVSAPAITYSASELREASGIPQSVLGWAPLVSHWKPGLRPAPRRGCVKHYETWEELGLDPSLRNHGRAPRPNASEPGVPRRIG